MTESHPSEPSLVPASIAGYRIERVLGRGMSTVYLAQHATTAQWVALKVLAAEAARDRAIRGRFVHEGDITARLAHPNVVPIYGRGETGDGQLWIAMQYVKGTDAEAALQAGAMTPARALRIVGEVALVLQHAHLRGVVHQDVKPSNILLEERAAGEERVILGDFGAAASAATGDPADSPLVASVAYAAPEVILGHRVDGRADVYSLGCTLFRLLSNRYPFPGDGDVGATISAHLRQSPVPLSHFVSWAGPGLDQVIGYALAKDPNDRYATTREFAAAATRAVQGGGARPVLFGSAAADIPRASAALGAPSPRPARSNKRLIVTGIAGLMVLIALVAWLVWPAPTPPSTPAASSPTSTTPVPRDLVERLQGLLPRGYPADSCAPPTAAESAAVALTCGPNLDPGGPATATYTLAADSKALHADFEKEIAVGAMVVCPGNIQSPGPWRRPATPNVAVGTLFCGIVDARPLVIWTNDAELLLARVESGNTAGPSLDQLYAWWSSHC